MSSINDEEQDDIGNQKSEKTMCQDLSRIDLNKESPVQGTIEETTTDNSIIVDDDNDDQQDKAMEIENEPIFTQKTGWQKYFGQGGDPGFKCNSGSDEENNDDDDDGQITMLYQIDEDSWESYFEEDFEDFDYY